MHSNEVRQVARWDSPPARARRPSLKRTCMVSWPRVGSLHARFEKALYETRWLRSNLSAYFFGPHLLAALTETLANSHTTNSFQLPE